METRIIETETFYGTDTDTIYVDSAGQAWLIKTTDQNLRKPQPIPAVPDGAEELGEEILDQRQIEDKYEIEYAIAANEHGTLYYGDTEVAITHSPWIDADGKQEFYRSTAVDKEGTDYEVRWHALTGVDTGDESDAADWDTYTIWPASNPRAKRWESSIKAADLLAAIKAGFAAGAEDDWDAPAMEQARKLTGDAGCEWDFDGWRAIAERIQLYGKITLGGTTLR